MGYDATSGEGNTTGHADQLQALSFAGSTPKLCRAVKMEIVDCNSRIVTARQSPVSPAEIY
jgi:hypothetical protein